MKSKFLCLIFIFTILALGFSATKVLADNWTTYGHDFQRTGLSGAGIDPDRLTRIWMYSDPTNAITFAGNMVTNDSLLFLAMSDLFGVDGRGDLVALRKSDGSFKWRFDSLRAGSSGRTSITLHNGKLYIGAGAGNTFRCVNADDGTQVWKASSGNVRFSASVIISLPQQINCTNYTHCDTMLGPPFDCEVGGDSGQLVLDSTICDTIAAEEVVFFGNESGQLYARKTSDGTLYAGWATNPKVPGGVTGAGVITNSVSSRNDTLYVGVGDAIGHTNGKLHAIDAKTGNILWSYTSAFGALNSAPVITSTGITFATYWPADAAQVLGRIHTVSPAGADVWAGAGTRGATAFYATPAVNPGLNRVVMGFTDAGIRARTLTTGGTSFSAGTHGFVRTPFAMSSNGYFAFNDDAGYWYLYKSNPGLGENPQKLVYAEFATQVYGLTGFSPIATCISSSSDTMLYMGEVFGNVFGFNLTAGTRSRTVAALGGLPLTINVLPGGGSTTETHTLWYNTGNATLTYSGLTAASTPALGSALYHISKVSPQREFLANNTAEELTSISSKGFVSNELIRMADVNMDESYFATAMKSEFIKKHENLAEGSASPGWLSIADMSATPGSIPTGDSIVVDVTATEGVLSKGIYTDGFIYVDGSNDPDPQLYTCPPVIPGTECRAFQQVIFLLAFPDQANYIVAEDPVSGDTMSQLFVTNYGAIADYQGNPGFGSSWYGFHDILFDGTIFVGTNATNMAGDFGFTFGRGNGDQLLGGSFLAESSFYQPSGLDSILVRTAAGTAFTNTGISVDVNMEAVAMSKAGLNEMILFKYDFINTGLSTLTNLYTGMGLDWDVYGLSSNRATGDVYNNQVQVSDGFYFQYVSTNTQDTLMGVLPLDVGSQPRTFRGVDNGVYIHPNAGFAWAGPPYTQLLALMDSAGIYFPSRRYDLSSLFTFDKADLAPGETTTVMVALGGIVDSTLTLPIIDTTLGPGSALATRTTTTSVIGNALRRYRQAAGFAPRGDIDTPGPVSGIPDGRISPADLVYLINYIFKNGPAPTPFEFLADMNGAGFGIPDGQVTTGDVIFLINYMFKHGPAPSSTGGWAW